jgi:hypothetical protein
MGCGCNNVTVSYAPDDEPSDPGPDPGPDPDIDLEEDPVVCPAGQMPSRAGGCLQLMQCPPGEVWDEAAQECVPGTCSGNQVLDEFGVCQDPQTFSNGAALQCPKGDIWDELLKGCVPRCADDESLDRDLLQCVKKQKCEMPNKVFDEATGVCVCKEGFVYNPKTYACNPPCKMPNKIFDEATGVCVCEEGFVYNPVTYACDPPCPTGMVRNGEGECTDCFFSNTEKNALIPQDVLEFFGLENFPTLDSSICDKDKEAVLDTLEQFFSLAMGDPFYGSPLQDVGEVLTDPLRPDIPGAGYLSLGIDPSDPLSNNSSGNPFAKCAEAFLNYIRFGRKKWGDGPGVLLYMDSQPGLKSFLESYGLPKTTDANGLSCEAKEGILDFAEDTMTVIGLHPQLTVPMTFMVAMLDFSRKRWDRALYTILTLGKAALAEIGAERAKYATEVPEKWGVLQFADDIAAKVRDKAQEIIDSRFSKEQQQKFADLMNRPPDQRVEFLKAFFKNYGTNSYIDGTIIRACG